MRNATRPYVQSANSDLMQPFVQARLKDKTEDAAARTASKAAIVGKPDGIYKTPIKGQYWGRWITPDGSDTLMMFWADSDEDNNPTADFQAGDSILVAPTSDTQPCQWRFIGMGYSYQSWQVTSTVPCGTNPDGTYRLPSISTTTAVFGLPNKPKQKVTPTYSDTQPQNPTDGNMWQDSTTNIVYRRSGDNNTGVWLPVSGPYSGTVVTRKLAINATAGTVVYQTSTADYADIANNTDLTHVPGRVLGVLVKDVVANAYGIIQQSGDVKLTNSFTVEAPLYFDSTGQLTETCPAAGSGAIAQRVAIANDSGFITVKLGPCVVRSL